MTATERSKRRYDRLKKSINLECKRRRKRAKTAASREATQQRLDEWLAALPLGEDGYDYRVGPCQVVLSDIPPNSVPLILTDPPYGIKAEPLYRWLAPFAARVLIPGGSLIVYTGNTCLYRDMTILNEHLRFHDQAILLHDSAQRLFGPKVAAGFKPILWYVKEFRRGRTIVPNVLHSTQDKSKHAWAPGPAGVATWIYHLTELGETILDPFAGTGARGKFAREKGRRWIGADVVKGGTTTVVAA